jgi:hypothetical protein
LKYTDPSGHYPLGDDIDPSILDENPQDDYRTCNGLSCVHENETQANQFSSIQCPEGMYGCDEILSELTFTTGEIEEILDFLWDIYNVMLSGKTFLGVGTIIAGLLAVTPAAPLFAPIAAIGAAEWAIAQVNVDGVEEIIGFMTDAYNESISQGGELTIYHVKIELEKKILPTISYATNDGYFNTYYSKNPEIMTEYLISFYWSMNYP